MVEIALLNIRQKATPVLFKYAHDNILIDVYAECFVDLLSYPETAKPRVTPVQFDDGIYEFL